ncbi:unnamed protein product [Linum trigynum]|uniref:SWIM-type domain-containing protein n=1 Tax=Linum trigynum TaxID=586398 RepID=A0AAV2FV89_9ROSI
MAPVYKMLAEVNDAAGIGVTSSYNAISRAGGGRKFVGFTKNDLKNHLRTVRTLSMEYGDATALLEYFRRQAQLDPGFFHEVEVDVEENIASIFWADGKMRMDYHYFGDSISFDTTYRTNKEYRPLALFVGFNNHHQLTVFAAALLYDETTATFEWLFDQFLKCMGGVRPLSMFTDQAAAIAAGIRSVFPDCFHGLCTWHIAQNAVVNLGSLCDSDFLRELSYLMYNADDEDDFEYNWKKMIEKCFPGKGPLGHSWLQGVYKVRKKWSSAWVNNYFGAGMKSTQLSECCNSNIRHYLQSEFSVSRFFVHFERMLDNKRDAEEQEEYYALSRLADSRFSTSPIVKQVANVYTPKIFKFFLDQYKESLAYNIFSNTEIEPEGHVGMFDVFILEDDHTRLDSRVLKVDFDNGEIKCSCRKWESSGLICKHQIKGYDMLWSTTCNLKFQHIPSSLILKRWTRAAKTRGNFSFEVPSTDSPSKYRSRLFNLSAVSASMISRVSMDDDLYKSAMAFMTDLIKKCEALSINEPAGTSTSSNGDNDVPVQKVKGFKPKKDSFKPSKRPIPVAEAARALSKKKRKTNRLEEEHLKAVEESLRLKL